MNAVFIRPSRIAGTSIIDGLSPEITAINRRGTVISKFPTEGLFVFGHMDYAMLVDKGYVNKEFDESAYKFSFVRNPYDRAVSAFIDLSTFHNRGNHELEDWVRSIGFLGFCKEMLVKDLRPIGLRHVDFSSPYNAQVRWLENVELDFLGRFENLNNDFDTLVSNLGIKPRRLPWRRGALRGQRSRGISYSSFYCPESRAIVESVYGEDFERFNYPLLHG